MSKFPNISIVINTLNRAATLPQILFSLRWQKYPGNFEVIVVNGPSTDQTEEILATWSNEIRIGVCPVANLSVSRNIGIAMAKGEIVAFIDDDAVPEPEWLTQIAAGYDSAEIGGVGGFVFDHTGYQFQYQYCLVNRLGDAETPFPTATIHFAFPNSYRFPHLLGTNCSFRRSVLLEIQGFDEEFEYFLDETDLCVRIIDAGYVIKQLNNAFVHHKYAPNNLRTHQRVIKNYYPIIKNKLYFSLKHARKHHSMDEIMERQKNFINEHRLITEWNIKNNLLDQAYSITFEDDAEKGTKSALEYTSKNKTKYLDLQKLEQYAGNFLPFKVLSNNSFLTIVLVSRGHSSNSDSETTRLVYNLAVALSAQGHIVHIIAESKDINRVDFINGIWLHHILIQNISLTASTEQLSIPQNLWGWSASALEEVRRISHHRSIDIIEAPIRNCEGIAFLTDGKWPLVTSLHTSVSCGINSAPELMLDQTLFQLERHLLVKSSAIRAESHTFIKQLENTYKCKFKKESLFIDSLEISAKNSLPIYLTAKNQQKKSIKISYVNSICVKYDAISNAIKSRINTLQQHGITNVRLYAYECDHAELPFKQVNSISDILEDHHFQSSDIVIFHFGVYYPLFDLLLNIPQNIKKLVVFHNITPKELAPKDSEDIINKSIAQIKNMNFSDHIICDSETNLEALKIFGINKPTSILPPLPADIMQSPPSTKPSFIDNIIRIVFIGRFVSSKGPNDLLLAIDSLLKNKHELKIKLDLIGNLAFSDKELLSKIERESKILLQKFVNQLEINILGSVTEQIKSLLLAEADIFVLPSYHEGFCVPILEAIHSGCQIVSYDNSNIPVISGGLAELASTGNISQLTSCINKVIDKMSLPSWQKIEYSQYLKKALAHAIKYDSNHFKQNFINFICNF